MVNTSPVLQIFAEEDAAVGERGRGEQDAVPPGEALPVLYPPSVLRDFEIIRRGAERGEPGDLRPSFTAAKEAATIGGNPIELI
jgi:hypothetical protein